MRISAFLLGLVLTASLNFGCAALLDTAQTPYNQIDTDPTTEAIEPVANSDHTPAQDILENVPKVITNPTDIAAWQYLVGAISTVILGGTGVYGVKKYRARKAAQ